MRVIAPFAGVLLLLVLFLVGVTADPTPDASSTPSLSAPSPTSKPTPGQVRIKLTRKTVPHEQHHFRTAHKMAALASEGFLGQRKTSPGALRAANAFYTDASLAVAMKNFYNRMYVGEVRVGTPAVPYSLVFDTGSADLWLFSAQSTKPRLSYVTYYDSTKSSTSRPTSTPWSIQYGKGSSSGTLVADTVSLAGKTVNGFTFAQATSYSDDFESPDMPLDGLLGLAFSSVNSASGPTLVDALKASGQIRDRVFSFYLTSDNPDGSEFVLGTPDLSLARGNLTYMDLASSSGMWILAMQQVQLNGAASSYCANGNDCAVLIDTGTSFIGMPTAAFRTFAAQVAAARSDCQLDSKSGLIICDRNTASNLPSIGFSIQGSLFTLSPSDYFDNGVLGFMAVDVGASSSTGGFWILGDTFLRRYYSVFDMDNQRIGIAGAKAGVPYNRSGSSSPFGDFGWQWILLLVCILLTILALVLCCCRTYRSTSRQRYASELAAQQQQQRNLPNAPYLLQPGPAFHSQAFNGQPVVGMPVSGGHVLGGAGPSSASALPRQFTGTGTKLGQAAYPGMATAPAPSVVYHPDPSAAVASRPPPTAYPQSDFARDFYASAGGQV